VSDPTVRPVNPVSLPELSTGILKQLVDLSPGKEVDNLRGRFEDLFRDFETRALRAGVAGAHATAAKYALAALVDETILLSDLPVKDEWLGKPLQMLYFDDFSAGEEFYNRLEQLRLHPTPETAEVLEVYHLCLAFGFKGKYGNAKGEERLKVIISGLVNDISQARGMKANAPLSPQAEAADVLPTAPALSFLGRGPLWSVPLGVLVLVVALYLVLDMVSSESLASFSTVMHGAAP
jgi:type VI secretion system protein ImpK